MGYSTYRQPTWSTIPPVVKNLVIINVLVFLAMYGLGLGAGRSPIGLWMHEWMALWPAGTPEVARGPHGGLIPVPRFYVWQLVTSAFMHGGLIHLFFNMFVLWSFGQTLENVWGSGRFALFYFWSAIGGSLVHLAYASAPFVLGIGTPTISPAVGASGAIFGLLVAFAMMYPDAPVSFFIIGPFRARSVVLVLAGLSLLAGISGWVPGIAHFAHLGGMAAGFVLMQYWRGKLRPGPPGPRRE